MIIFDNFSHAKYAKENCKSHQLLMSSDTIVDFYKTPVRSSQTAPPPEKSKNKYKMKAIIDQIDIHQICRTVYRHLLLLMKGYLIIDPRWLAETILNQCPI